jgi:hypothetical protein
MFVEYVIRVEIEAHPTESNPEGKRFSRASLVTRTGDGETVEEKALGVQPTMSKGAAGAMGKGYSKEVGRQIAGLIAKTYPYNKRADSEEGEVKTPSRKVRK